MNNKFTVKDIALVAVLTSILFVQEQLLTFLPNISFTIFLMFLYSKKLGFIKSSIIILIHVFLDNLLHSSFSIMYFPFMLLGYMVIPTVTSIFLKKVNAPLLLSLFGILFSFIYCFSFFIPNALFLEIDMLAYFISDIPFELLLAASSFLSILWLYKPCSNLIDKLYQKENSN